MPKFISDEVFAKWAAQWQALEHSREPFGFFNFGSKLLLGDFFDGNDFETLVSTPGISVIKVRFGFDTEETAFTLVLFGVDSAGQIITPYYAHAPGDFRGSGRWSGRKCPRRSGKAMDQILGRKRTCR
jgi:hypothetical protein